MSPQHPTVPLPVSRLVSVEGRTLPLRAVSLRASAQGGLARVILEQRFENPHAEVLAVTYRLPLPADGAVSGYAFRIGGRRIVGQIDGWAAARERFEQAVVDGRGAAILEEERSSLFTQEIQNIPPGAEILAEITVDQRLAWLDEGAWEWRFPTAAAPRYLGASGAVRDRDRVAVEVAGAPLLVRFSLELLVRDALSEGGRPRSPSHALASEAACGAVRVGLGAGQAPLDRDVVVRWQVAQPAAGVTLDVARPPSAASAPDRRPDAEPAYALLTLVPPVPSQRPAVVPRDLVILLDRSGSMGGEPLAQAGRVCAALVDTLGPADSLELCAFGSDVDRFRPEPVPVTPETKREAMAWIASREAGGGTEMREGIAAALGGLRADGQRQVVIVSDGLVGFEQETVADVLARLPGSSRLHTVGIGAAVNRSFTAAAARAGRGVEVILGPGEDPEIAARRIVSRTAAPILVDVEVEGGALLGAPQRIPDLYAGAPALSTVGLRAEGGDLLVRGRTADGIWEQRVQVPRTAPGAGSPAVLALFGREAVEDAEVRRAAGEDPAAVDALVERLGLQFKIATRLTSWVAVDTVASVDPGGPVRHVRVPQELPQGLSAEALGLRAPAPPRPRDAPPAARPRITPGPSGGGDFDEKTRVTQVIQPAPAQISERSTDCLVVVYTKEPLLLGKRFVLEDGLMRIGRGSDGFIVLDGDSVSRRHAHLERRSSAWIVVDDGSTNGTYVNDERISREARLASGDRVKIGPTIFKFLSGADVEAQYHEEIYRLTIMDGLTQIHNKRYLLEALERDVVRARRHDRDLSLVIFDVDHFKRVNDEHGHLAGDHMLKELARVVEGRLRRDEVFARYGGEEFAVILPEITVTGAAALAEALRQQVREHAFVFQGTQIPVTISAGAAALDADDQKAADLIRRADAMLYRAKQAGRDRVVS
jgi:Ca-activated chloride channel family protein